MTSDDRLHRLEKMLYHQVTDPADIETMAELRKMYIRLGLSILEMLPEGDNKQECLSLLEMSLMRGIQSLAVQGVAVIPDGLFDGME